MSTAVTLDHVGLAGRDLAEMAAAYERLGFSLSPVARQAGRRRPELPVEPWGSANRCAFLRHGYLELLAVLDPALYDNQLTGFLDRYPGMHVLALAIEDEEANLARMRAAGIDIPGVAWLERPVEPGGPIVRFARLPLPDSPEGRVQLVRHMTPDTLWQERWMNHANEAVALEEAILSAREPAETAERLARVAGMPLEPDPTGGFLLRLPGAARASGPFAEKMETRVRVVPEDALSEVLPGVTAPASPFMAGMVIRTSDGATAVRRLLEGLPTRPAPGGGVMVPPEHAAGTAVVFV